jgi:hypothetical protein
MPQAVMRPDVMPLHATHHPVTLHHATPLLVTLLHVMLRHKFRTNPLTARGGAQKVSPLSIVTFSSWI